MTRLIFSTTGVSSRSAAKSILLLFFVSVVSAAIISLLMTPIFQAKATLMPVESSQGRFSAALGSLQNLPFVGGAVGGTLGKTATDKLISIMNSRTVAEDVIKSLKLVPILFQDDWDEKNNRWKINKPPTLQDTVRLLQKDMVKIADDRKGLISISVEYKNPELAANIANEYMDALQRFLSTSAISLAKRNRIFLEKQIGVTKKDLKETEESLKDFQTSKKICCSRCPGRGSHQGPGRIESPDHHPGSPVRRLPRICHERTS